MADWCDDYFFNEAFETLMKHEGGYVNDKVDNGGETKFGISKRSYPNLDIKKLTRDEAKRIYYCDFWLKGRYNKILRSSIAVKTFDLAVNMGITQANQLLQRAIRSANLVKIAEDGIIGNITIEEISKAAPAVLLAALRSEAAGFYRSLAAKNPNQKKFLNGWLNRAYC